MEIKNNNMKTKMNALNYETIAAATHGDLAAIRQILKHYEKYILSICIAEQIDAPGNHTPYIDEHLKLRLETKLISRILTFNAHSIA